MSRATLMLVHAPVMPSTPVYSWEQGDFAPAINMEICAKVTQIRVLNTGIWLFEEEILLRIAGELPRRGPRGQAAL